MHDVPTTPPRVTVIAGGVGAARFLRQLRLHAPRAQVTAVVNTGDDTVFHGLSISPDIDTVTYTVSGSIDPDRGWGMAGETWTVMRNLHRYEPYGANTWFNLGDRDLATHLWRTGRLKEGATLTEVSAAQALAWELGLRLLPMTDQTVATVVDTHSGRLAFQEYFVRHRHEPLVSQVTFEGVGDARPAPGVLDAITGADVVVIAPSNPIVSIGPVLAVPGVLDALVARRRSGAATVAISPIIGGVALKGPADTMLTTLGHESSALGVARIYRNVVSTLVIDTEDAHLAPLIASETDLEVVVTRSVMSEPGVGATLVTAVLGAS